jgi:hypothetical protein
MFFYTKIKSLIIANIATIARDRRFVNIYNFIRNFPTWWSSLDPGRNPLADKVPWIALSAIKFLDHILNKNMLVYEYGSGGSTLFFASRVKEVISTEHDQMWYRNVIKQINENHLSNCRVRLIEPTPINHFNNTEISNPNDYVSDDERYVGMSFINYASSIDEYPDEYFDIILIDGRARPSCFKHSERKLRKGGYLILDNAERPYYHFVHDVLKEKCWRKYDYYGLFPYQSHFSETCIWQKM